MRLLLSFALALGLVVGLAACDTAESDPAQSTALAPTANAAAKSDVCHYDADADTYALINIADRALGAHRAHGDAIPGEAVPTMEGFTFDEVCIPERPYTVIDMEEMSQTVGDRIGNSAEVLFSFVDSQGYNVLVIVFMSASDGGYVWRGLSYFENDQNQGCRYPIVQVRARAELGSESYRMDFDGYAPNGLTGSFDLEGPWDFAAGHRPTVIGESITVDTTTSTCS